MSSPRCTKCARADRGAGIGRNGRFVVQGAEDEPEMAEIGPLFKGGRSGECRPAYRNRTRISRLCVVGGFLQAPSPIRKKRPVSQDE